MANRQNRTSMSTPQQAMLPDAVLKRQTPRRCLRNRVIELQHPEDNRMTEPTLRNSQDVPLNRTTSAKRAAWVPETDSSSDSDECVLMESTLDLTEKEPENVSPGKVTEQQEIQLETEDAKECDSHLEITQTSEKQSLSSEGAVIPGAKIPEIPKRRLRNRVIEIQPPVHKKIATRSQRNSQDVLNSSTPAKRAVRSLEPDSDDCVVVESTPDLTEKEQEYVSPAKLKKDQEIQMETVEYDSYMEMAQAAQERSPKTLISITPVSPKSELIITSEKDFNPSDEPLQTEPELQSGEEKDKERKHLEENEVLIEDLEELDVESEKHVEDVSIMGSVRLATGLLPSQELGSLPVKNSNSGNQHSPAAAETLPNEERTGGLCPKQGICCEMMDVPVDWAHVGEERSEEAHSRAESKDGAFAECLEMAASLGRENGQIPHDVRAKGSENTSVWSVGATLGQPRSTEGIRATPGTWTEPGACGPHDQGHALRSTSTDAGELHNGSAGNAGAVPSESVPHSPCAQTASVSESVQDPSDVHNTCVKAGAVLSECVEAADMSECVQNAVMKLPSIEMDCSPSLALQQPCTQGITKPQGESSVSVQTAECPTIKSTSVSELHCSVGQGESAKLSLDRVHIPELKSLEVEVDFKAGKHSPANGSVSGLETTEELMVCGPQDNAKEQTSVSIQIAMGDEELKSEQTCSPTQGTIHVSSVVEKELEAGDVSGDPTPTAEAEIHVGVAAGVNVEGQDFKATPDFIPQEEQAYCVLEGKELLPTAASEAPSPEKQTLTSDSVPLSQPSKSSRRRRRRKALAIERAATVAVNARLSSVLAQALPTQVEDCAAGRAELGSVHSQVDGEVEDHGDPVKICKQKVNKKRKKDADDDVEEARLQKAVKQRKHFVGQTEVKLEEVETGRTEIPDGGGELGTVCSQVDIQPEDHEDPVTVCKQKVNKKRKKYKEVEEARQRKALKKTRSLTGPTEEKLEEVETERAEECEQIPAKPAAHRLIVRNLDPSRTFSELQIALIHFFLKRKLSLTGIKIKKSRKQGHLTFLSEKDLNRAMGLDGKLLLGNVLQLHKPQELGIPTAVLNEKSKESDAVFQEKKKIQGIAVLNEKSKESDTVFREKKKKKKVQEMASWCLYMRNLNSKKRLNTLREIIQTFLSRKQLPFNTVTVDHSRRSACVDLLCEDDLNKALEFDGFKILGKIARFSKVEKLGELDQEQDARTIYIKNFPVACSRKDLKKLFPNAIKVQIKTHPRKSKRFAFILFKTVRDAKQALRRSGKERKGQKIEIKRIFTPALPKVRSPSLANTFHTKEEASSQPPAKRKHTQAEDKGFSGDPVARGDEESKESDTACQENNQIQEIVLNEKSQELDSAFREKKKKKKSHEMASPCLYMRNLNSWSTSKELEEAIENFLSSKKVPFTSVRVNPSRRSACVDLACKDGLNKALEFDGFKILGKIARFSKVEKLSELDQEEDARILYVKHFPNTLCPNGLQKAFTNAIDVQIKSLPKKNKRFAFVQFKTKKDANKAFRRRDMEVDGNIIKIERTFCKVSEAFPEMKIHTQAEASSHIPAKDTNPTNTLFIRGLSRTSTIGTLMSAFDGAVSARIPVGEQPVPFGFVEFETPEEAEEAMAKVQNTQIDGSLVEIYFSKTSQEKGRHLRSFNENAVANGIQRVTNDAYKLNKMKTSSIQKSVKKQL